MTAADMLTTGIVVWMVFVIPCLSQGFQGKSGGSPGVKGALKTLLDEKIPYPTVKDKQTLEERSMEGDGLLDLENDETLSNYKLLANSHERSLNDLTIEDNGQRYKLGHFDIRSQTFADSLHISLDDYIRLKAEKDLTKKEEEEEIDDSLREEEDDENIEERSINRKSRGRKGKKKTKKPQSAGSGGSVSGGKEESWWPNNFGIDMDVLDSDHPQKKLRSGKATLTDSCNNIRSVPSSLRSSNNFIPPIHNHYQKYTEAYGIPIIGSRSVTDHGLKRTCYMLKVLFADRYDIRNLYYKLFGRFALIADDENQTDLPEYATWDSSKWDSRARGLGPTLTTPTTSAGDDNQRCQFGERYFDQDIATHELGHAIEQMGTYLAVPGFKHRINSLFQSTVVKQKKYLNKYASENTMEYFAVGVQFYFNAFRGSSYHQLGVRDRSSLRRYDSGLVGLLDEVFPCASKNYNTLIHRCKWKECTLKKDWQLVFDSNTKAKSNCENVKTSYSKDSAEACAQYACYVRANVINWKGSTCHALKCAKTATNSDLKLQQGSSGYNIYKITSMPQPDLKEEFSQKVRQMCTKGPEAYRCQLSSSEKKVCSKTKSAEECRGMGCCMIGSSCYYPKQDCADKSLLCSDLANKGDCGRNPIFMIRHCPIACDFCKHLSKLNLDKLKDEFCQDKSVFCKAWTESGECKRNPAFMDKTCPVGCSKCKPKSPVG